MTLENFWSKALRLAVWAGELFVGGAIGYLYVAPLAGAEFSTFITVACGFGLRKLAQGIIDYNEDAKLTTAGRKLSKPLTWYFK